jgi:phage shock protein A
MSLRSRVALLLNMKTSAALDAVEDPREVLDYAYGQQRTRLHRLKRGRVEVATARRLTERHIARLREQAKQAEEQARRALRANREDLARTALERKQALLKELRTLDRQLQELTEEDARLARADRQLSLRVERFRLRRTVLSARYTAAEAQAAAGEVVVGLSGDEELELTLAVERAEETVERVSAHAIAIDVLDEPSDHDRVEEEISSIDTRQAVDEELASLRQELNEQTENGENA